MGIASFFDNQLAILDQAESIAVQHLAPSFADIRAHYSAVNIDIAAQCEHLLEVCREARTLRAHREAAQNRLQAEAADVHARIADVDRWCKVLAAALAYARASEHPLAARVTALYAGGRLPTDTYRGTMDHLLTLLAAAQQGGDLSGLPLPSGFVAQGVALWEELKKEQAEATLAESDRKAYTLVLHDRLDEVGRVVQRLHAAREAAAAVSGVDLPGFDLALLRGASASRATDDDTTVTLTTPLPAGESPTELPPLTALPTA
jgi:hypothetical protein